MIEIYVSRSCSECPACKFLMEVFKNTRIPHIVKEIEKTDNRLELYMLGRCRPTITFKEEDLEYLEKHKLSWINKPSKSEPFIISLTC